MPAVQSPRTGNRSREIIALALVSGSCYAGIAYFTARTSFYQLMLLYTSLFLAYWRMMKLAHEENENLYIACALIFRLIFLLALPALSDDFYRFIWDGRLLGKGMNPYLTLPAALSHEPGLEALYPHLNSSKYYTVYPPLNQWIFAGSAFFFSSLSGSVIAMRCILLLADLGTVMLMRSLLKAFQLPVKNVWIFALNPLIIIELSGNLHFEGLMLFFLLLSVWLLYKNKLYLSAISLGISAGLKLLPLIFLPLFLKKLGLRKGIPFLLIFFTSLSLPFLSFYSPELLRNIFSSIDLYFQKFEFNASVYYVIRWIGYQVKGYNIIGFAGILLGALSTAAIILISSLKKNLEKELFFQALLFCISIYLLLALVVHPWYLTLPLAFSVFLRYRFVALWSFLVFLSYFTYRQLPYQESLVLTTLEYSVLIGFAAYEFSTYCTDTMNRQHSHVMPES